MKLLALALSAATAATPQLPIDGNSSLEAGFESESLAHNLDGAVKICSAMIISTANKAGPYAPEQLMRENGQLRDIPEPGADLAALANPKFGEAKFARWADPHARVIVMSYKDSPSCRVFVSNAAWSAKARPQLERLVQVGDFWRVKSLAEPTSGGPRSVFSASLPDGKSEAMLTITGFETNVGTIAVALVAKEPG